MGSFIFNLLRRGGRESFESFEVLSGAPFKTRLPAPTACYTLWIKCNAGATLRQSGVRRRRKIGN
jgi:hypothetical protein